MGLLNYSAILPTIDTVVYTCGAGKEANVHSLVFGNVTSLPATVMIKVFDSSIGTTAPLGILTVNVGGTTFWPKIINLEPGDQLICSANVASAVGMNASILEDDGLGVVAIGFTPMGVYASGTTYSLNDVVSYGGATYVSRSSDNMGNTPNSSPTKWMNLAVASASGISFTPTDGLTSNNIQAVIAELDAKNDFFFCLSKS